MMRRLVLRSDAWPVENGAELYALLLFPSHREESKRLAIRDALMARYRHNLDQVAPVEAASVLEDRPDLTVRLNRRELGGLEHRSKKALDVGRGILVNLKEVMTGQPPVLPPGMQNASLKQMTNILRPSSSLADPENTYRQFRRDWNRWMPVAHLAAACAARLNYYDVSRAGFQLDDPEIHRSTVEVANIFAAGLQTLPHLGWHKSDPVELIWEG